MKKGEHEGENSVEDKTWDTISNNKYVCVFVWSVYVACIYIFIKYMYSLRRACGGPWRSKKTNMKERIPSRTKHGIQYQTINMCVCVRLERICRMYIYIYKIYV